MQHNPPQITDIPPRASKHYPPKAPLKTRNTDNFKAAPKPAPKTIQLESPRPKGCGLPVGCLLVSGAVCFLALIFSWYLVVIPAAQNVNDQYTTGYGRVSKLQANVGHGEISTFLSLDLHGYATVIEIFPDKSKNPAVYKEPQLASTNLVVTLELVGVNHDGKTDLAVHVENSDVQTVLVNNGSEFQWTT